MVHSLRSNNKFLPSSTNNRRTQMLPPFYDSRLQDLLPPVSLQLKTQQTREALVKTSQKYSKLSSILFSLLRTRKELQRELTRLETQLFEKEKRIHILPSRVQTPSINLNKPKTGVSSSKASALLNKMPEEERKALIASILKNSNLGI